MQDRLIRNAVHEFTEYFSEVGFKVSATAKAIIADFRGIQVFLEMPDDGCLQIRTIASKNEEEKHHIILSNRNEFLLKNKNPELLQNKYTKYNTFTDVLRTMFI